MDIESLKPKLTKSEYKWLKEEILKYRAIANSSNDKIALATLSGKYKYVSPSIERILGYKPEDLIGKSVFENIHPDDKKHLLSILRKYISARGKRIFRGSEKDQLETFEYRHLRKDNSWCWLETAASIVGNQLLFVSRDITERKLEHTTLELIVAERTAEQQKAIQLLRDSEKKFHELADLLPQPVFEIDLNFLFTFANKAAFEFTGYSEQELAKGNIDATQLVIPEDAQRLSVNIRKRFAGELSHGIEYTAKRKNGSTFPCIIWSAPIIKEGSPVGLRGVVVDITSIKQAESALSQSETRLESFFKCTGEGVYIFEFDHPVPVDIPLKEQISFIYKNGFISDANDRYVQVYGYTKGTDIIGKRLTDLYGSEDNNVNIEIMEEWIRKGYRIVGAVSEEIDRNGKRLYISNNCIGVVEDGHLLRIWGTKRDVTREYVLEKEAAKIQALESLEQLAGGLAHDFNNSLTGILGNISLAINELSPDHTVYQYLQEAIEAIGLATNLTRQLLTFSKEGIPCMEATQVADIITHTVRFTLSGSAVAPRFVFDKNLHIIPADKAQISQVIQNLTINAKQAMPEGGEITIEAHNVILGSDSGMPLHEGNYIEISFKDSGSGISREILEKIFDPYFTTKKRGSGLGLAICDSITHRHGGHIKVESKVGEGATFRIYLPVSHKLDKPESFHSDEIISGTGKVLLMDDDSIVRKAAAVMLNRLGYIVETTPEGQIAAELFRKAFLEGNPFDVVILDLTVPGGLGAKQTLGLIREIKPNAKVIVSSGYSKNVIIAEHGEHKFDAVLNKPYTVSKLSKTLCMVIEQPEAKIKD